MTQFSLVDTLGEWFSKTKRWWEVFQIARVNSPAPDRKRLSDLFLMPAGKNIGATIRIGGEIRCLPYV